LPARGRLARPDAISPAIKMDVLSNVATVVNSGQAGTNMEVDVGQKAMLRIVRAYADGTRISFSNFKVDVADGGIERAGVRIRRRFIRLGSTTREKYHVRRPSLKTRSLRGEHKCRARGPISN
jgi:hypothetical protein